VSGRKWKVNPMMTFKARTLGFLGLWVVWLLLTAPWSTQEAVAGALVAVLISLLPFSGASPLGDLKLSPKALAWLVAYVFVFIKALVQSNLDVAFRVLHPKLPIDPGIVKVKTRLKTPLGRLLLANSITLTPGTITVEMRGDDLYIHWIKVADPDPEAATAAIVGNFEKYLEVICG
jgi:multicomponent Na+:H+ antiporter subunit E